MTGTRAIAHGRSAAAVLNHLHGWKAKPISLHQPIEHAAEPVPKGRADLEERCRHALAAPAGEMIYLNASTTHISADRDDVQHALGLARQLGGDDPVDALEHHLDDTLACLRSPRVWNAVRTLAGALMRAPRGEMSAKDAERVVRQALHDRRGADLSRAGHPRRIYVRTSG
jgi:hypothetical protein